ncbi:MAG: hypothetical protein IJH76_03575 [Clostridia bacterium]|nr:hypothetical protein [Clostridia bacterium]
MENASKALVMAGGVLISIIIISMFMLMLNDLTSFQENEDTIKIQEQVVAFNKQYDGYNRNDVKGNELISLLKKVDDYNYRKSSATGAQEGNDSYEPITITIDLTDSSGNKADFSRGTGNELFTENKYVLNAVGSPLQDILTQIDRLKNNEIEVINIDHDTNKFIYDETVINDLVKAYDKIFISDESFEKLDTSEKMKIFYNVNIVFGQNVFKLYKNNNTSLSDNELKKLWNDYLKEDDENSLRGKVNLYNEYVQFKRAYFKCEGENGGSGIEYNQNTGRIKSMYFKFTGGI